ncbi:MAG: electron transport complex subunit RsxE [Gammaproteobacteria bacterium]|nr:electron transport complex subunit RsxE [Gammaproteobacteria bacterium]
MPILNRFTEAAVARNPAWVQLLGLCPLLAVSNTIANALGLAVASAVVLIGSAALVSLTRRFIPADVRLPCFVLVIATFTTLVNLAMEAYAFDLYQRIALFVQIIVTNCMILARIEQVAAKESLGRTLLDACGAAVGFAAAILALGAAREVLAIGFPLAALPPGAFLVAGLLLALTNLRRGDETETGAAVPTDERPDTRSAAGQR